MRKFTRKEHFVRHKCDRRPNKPYNVTNEAYRRMSASQRAAARHAVKALSLGRDRFGSSMGGQTDAPLELTTTCHSSRQSQEDVPPRSTQPGHPSVPSSKLLFTGGTMSSPAVISLGSSIYRALSSHAHTGHAHITSGHAHAAAHSPSGCLENSIGGVEALDVTSSTNLVHNNMESSRRKSSKPRKVVASDDNGTIESDGTTVEMERASNVNGTIETTERINIGSDGITDNGYSGRLNFATAVPLSVIEQLYDREPKNIKMELCWHSTQ